jgi:class 3 adenylate cyclase
MTLSRRYFRRHLTSEQTEALLKHIDASSLATDIPLGAKVDHDCSIIFFDLCNFTNISWSISTDRILEILQDLFGFVSRSVSKYQGMIDKYPGDGVVAFFPRNYADDSDEIVEYTLDCATEVMYWFYDKMRWRYDLPKESHSLDLAIGVDAGRISIAHVGSVYHSELILLGDQVNAASKCQQAATKKEVVIGQEAAERVRNLYSNYFATGPATGIVYTATNARYLSYRFNWEEFAKIATWVDKSAR